MTNTNTTATVTRKSLIAALKKAHKATEVCEVEARRSIEGWVSDLREGYWNIHQAMAAIRKAGIRI